MGQKVNPLSLRAPINKKWDSKSFFPCFNYTSLLHQDLQIRRYVYGILYYFNILCNRCIIKRVRNKIYLNIYIFCRVNVSQKQNISKLLLKKKFEVKKKKKKKKEAN